MKIKKVPISEELFMALMRQGTSFSYTVKRGLPNDAKLYYVESDVMAKSVTAYITSEEYEEVESLDQAPWLDSKESLEILLVEPPTIDIAYTLWKKAGHPLPS